MKRSNNSAYKVVTVGELKKHYGLTSDNREIVLLKQAHVPKALWPLIPYAELWGISDDVIREDFTDRAPESAKAELKSLLRQYSAPLNEWLAGPEAKNPKPTREYIAFSAMRMTADSF